MSPRNKNRVLKNAHNAQPQECAEADISFEDRLALRADLDKAHYHVSPNAGLGKAYISPCFKTSCFPSSMVCPLPVLGTWAICQRHRRMGFRPVFHILMSP